MSNCPRNGVGASDRDAVLANRLDRLAEQVEVRAATFAGDTVALGSALMPVEALVHGSPG